MSARILLCLVALSLSQAPAAEPSIDFNRDIRPILSDKCYFCHGPAEDSREAGLRLDIRQEAVDYGAIAPHDTESSLLVERIETTDPDFQMPPPSSNKSLTDEQKQTLRRWIDSGAKYAKHWSFSELPKQVTPPESGREWAKNPVDQFVHERLRSAGLHPNKEADRRVWLRRVTFDLTGLPPTEEAIAAFLADDSPVAYERVVDRLFESDAHAERLASEWLDVARYSDSYGYQRDDERFVWPYRDWVIKAFRENQPYDEFVTWQVAGDLLPEATREQRLATVFCRLHSHKKEGGVAIEEFRVENVADRTHTFASAFLGLTMECARCHDHKYDAISAKDYYSLSSFFANVDERGLISFFTDATPTPAMPLPSPEQERALAEAAEAVRESEQELADATEAAEERFNKWLGEHDASAAAVDGLVTRITFDTLEANPPEVAPEEPGDRAEQQQEPGGAKAVVAFANEVDGAEAATTNELNRAVEGATGQGLRLTGDDAVVVPGVGHIERHEALTVSIWVRPSEVKERNVIFRRSRGWDDAGSVGYALVQRGQRLRATIAHFWPGNAISVETEKILQPDRWFHVTVTYDGSSKAAGLRIHVDGQPAANRVVKDSLTRTIARWQGGYDDLAIGARYRDRGFKNGVVDDFRVYDRALTPLEVRHELDGQSLSAALAARADASPGSRSELLAYYLANHDGQVAAARAELRQARAAWNQAMDAIPAITVMQEQETPRPAYVLERGQYDSHGEEVTADTPSALPDFPADQPNNRLGLARWLFQPDHPLTARVAVNRYWQLLFGAGLVRTPEDFGSQGAPPTHPELLDWLARDFVDNGWDVRRLLRTLVLSSTYRQSSVVDPKVRAIDPENRLLSRGPSKRLTAEMLRDNVLFVSHLLADEVGGPPVKPYDLSLAYTPVPVGAGDELYRRSLYTFWKRTSPSPVMMTMNANRREVCLLRREVVSSPLQALVLLNGTQFVEAARVYAEQLLNKHDGRFEPAIGEAFVALTSREPSPEELEVLLSAYREQLEQFESDAEGAEKYLKVGTHPTSSSTDRPTLAAATVVVNAIMNLDEAIRCR